MKYSILNPKGTEIYNKLSEVAIHDLGLDLIVKEVTKSEPEQRIILNTLMQITADCEITKYRYDVFDDIYKNKTMRDELMEILEKIDFLREYGSFKREYDESVGVWDLMHRLDEMNDYIDCVEAIQKCLASATLNSEGLIGLKKYVDDIYEDSFFDALKEDIKGLRATTNNMRSVTVGINLNDRFEADTIGIVSVNDKPFSSSGIISNFAAKLSSSDKIQEGSDWNGNLKFTEFGATSFQVNQSLEQMAKMNVMRSNPLSTMVGVPLGDVAQDVTRYMDRVVNHMLSSSVKRIRQVLSKYASVTITDMTDLIPEFAYYIRWAEYIEKLSSQGATFCKPSSASINSAGDSSCKASSQFMHARGVYNFKLAAFMTDEHEEIITNDLDFDSENRVYILTGANRGGKTTITQAIGQLFVLAQGGIYVPGTSFEFAPVDNVFTHFPADEDKTMDLGRLGEECKRFKDIYKSSTDKSLLLLNETFSTTSFEEGYYIAKDSVKAILSKGSRTIYNTHMHKLAFDIDELNQSTANGAPIGKAVSLIVKSDAGKRSYKVEIAPPEGQSYAKDIAEKYGVTYEMLTETQAYI